MIDQKTKLIATGVAALLITLFIGSLWSNHKIASLEREIEKAKTVAAEKQKAGELSEQKAAEHRAKTEYLEQQIAEINAIARKQDEELGNLSKNVDSARGNVERARRVRSVAATADELCAKLADLGHPCE